jgi:hypothetical protein
MEENNRVLSDQHANIKGWGIDADPENEPTYPMKNYTGDDHARLNYVRPVQQRRSVEILQSNERPSVSAVFGTSTPPSGFSGMIRRYAFRFSEGSWGHWLPLILADRVNMIEGLVNDFKEGHVPNMFAERGWNAEWKYNQKGLLKKAVVGVAIISAIITYKALKNRNNDKDS